MSGTVRIVGILNVTPDSYYDGGKFDRLDAALAQADRMLDEGADVLEAGGESTGPGSASVSAEEELARVLPVVRALCERHPGVPLAVDTYKAAVAEASLAAGATMINDVTAGREDPALFGVVAAAKASLVLMYAKDPTPRTTRDVVPYGDVAATVAGFLRERAEAARAAGVDAARIVVDPGMGHFVSGDPAESFRLLSRLPEIAALGYPVLVSPSRKSLLAGRENLPPADRLPGTIAASAVAVLHGASYIRTHDVLEVRRACEIALAIRDA